MQRLQSIHQLASAQAQLRKAAAAEQRSQSAAAVRLQCEDGALVLSERLKAKHEAKHAEEERIRREEKRVQFEQMQRAAGASVVEEQKFRWVMPWGSGSM